MGIDIPSQVEIATFVKIWSLMGGSGATSSIAPENSILVVS